MGFIVGLIVGIAIGIGLIMAFARGESRRSKHRSDLAKTIAALARMTVQDSRKLLGPQHYPSWLTWLNQHLDKIWPYVNEAASELIKSNVEPILEQYTPAIFDSLKFSTLTLGNPVGTLEVKLVEAKELPNMDIVGKSDPFAVIFIRPLPDRTKTSKVIDNDLNPIWNEHFEFIVEDDTTQRLTVRIYDDEGLQAAEFIGCCQISLSTLEPGKVKNVWLKLFKDLDIQRDTKYRGQVHLELLYCPFGTDGNIVNPFDHEFSLTSLEKALKIDNITKADLREMAAKKKEMFIRGVLSVTVISAEDLPIVDFMGKTDPYVVLLMKKSEAKQKTRVITNNLNPVWNQTFDFMVEDALHEMVIIEVWDHDTFGKDRIGRVIMTLTRVLMEGEYQECYNIDLAKSGRVTLSFKWVPQHKVRDSS
ncbi:hypothetical protein ACLB2K_014506 [Fragaria x ananassa]